MFDFAWHYALPVVIFAYCYGRILSIIKRQKKVVGNQDITMATTSRDRNAGQLQVQEPQAVAKPGTKLSRTQLNVLHTMITVIVCFIVCWTPGSLANVVQSLGVCFLLHALEKLGYFAFRFTFALLVV